MATVWQFPMINCRSLSPEIPRPDHFLNIYGIALLNTLKLYAKYSHLMDKHTANHVQKHQTQISFTVSVLTYAMYTYNIIIKQDTELSIVDAHIMEIFLVP